MLLTPLQRLQVQHVECPLQEFNPVLIANSLPFGVEPLHYHVDNLHPGPERCKTFLEIPENFPETTISASSNPDVLPGARSDGRWLGQDPLSGKLGNADHTFLSTEWTSTVVRGLE
jgi:hypothetical protein